MAVIGIKPTKVKKDGDWVDLTKGADYLPSVTTSLDTVVDATATDTMTQTAYSTAPTCGVATALI